MKSLLLLVEVIVVCHPVKQATMTQALILSSVQVGDDSGRRWIEVGDQSVVANAMRDLVAVVVVVVAVVAATMRNQSRSKGQRGELGRQAVVVERVCRTQDTWGGRDLRSDCMLAS